MNKSIMLLGSILHFLKRNIRFFGLPLVYLSIILLAAFYFFGLTNHNALLFPIILIPVGIWNYIYQERHWGDY